MADLGFSSSHFSAAGKAAASFGFTGRGCNGAGVDWGVVWEIDRGHFILQNQGQLRMGSDFPGFTDGLLHTLRLLLAQSTRKF